MYWIGAAQLLIKLTDYLTANGSPGAWQRCSWIGEENIGNVMEINTFNIAIVHASACFTG